MGIKFCKHCNLAKPSNKVRYRDGAAICAKCGREMSDMGHAKAKISPEETINRYDEANKYKDLSQIKGKTTHYQSPSIESTLIECEDRLKVNPDDIQANYTLGKLLFTEEKMTRAKDHLFKVARKVAVRWLYSLKIYFKLF